METLTLASATTPQRAVRCHTPSVYLSGQRSRRLAVESWQVLPAPVFGLAKLRWLPSAEMPPEGRIEDIMALPPVGTEILIRPAAGSGGGEFPGIICAHHVEATENGEILIAEARHVLAQRLSTRLASRWHLIAGTLTEAKPTNVTFNGGSDTYASPALFEFNKRSARAFDASASAQKWSAADALGYLIATAVPQYVETPGIEELEQLAGGIALGTLDVTGKTAAEALVEVAHRAGIEIRASRHGLGIVFFRPGRDGRHGPVRLQKAGQSLWPDKTNLWRGRISFRRRPARRQIIAFGERKRYESTFQLKAGWDASLEGSRWRDFVRSESENWPQLANVYRKWVLNEHGWYNSSPWQLDVHDFSTVSGDDFCLHVPRRFLPCLSTDPVGSSLGSSSSFAAKAAVTGSGGRCRCGRQVTSAQYAWEVTACPVIFSRPRWKTRSKCASLPPSRPMHD